MQNNTDIIFEEIIGENGNLGLITLNRPSVLNALNHSMFMSLDKYLKEWEQAVSIKAIVIRAAEGRAFCAGGDIRYAYEKGLAKDPSLPHFFRDEYRLNQYIYHYSKPYIALMNGITMGGGVGISIHGSHRIGTKRLSFSMPETGIGFFPDVGATYFLTRLPGKIGFYLGLTGARIPYNDCLAAGLIDQVIAEDSLQDLINKLAGASLEKNAEATISDICNQFTVPVEKSVLMEHEAEINACFSKNTIEEIFAALENYPSEWCQEVLSVLQKKSPTSLKITLRQLQLGKKLNFDECMKLEYRLTNRFLHNLDFFEGVRAAIIDKDQQPKWQPSTLEEVKASNIESYFLPLENELIE